MKAKDLRSSILQMAVQGKLVPQDPSDEPASVLLERIRAERAKLIKEKKIKAPKGGESVIYRASDGSHYEKRGEGEPVCIDDEIPFEIPESWAWSRIETVSTDPRYGTSAKSQKTGTFPVLRMGNITKDGGLDYSNLVFTSDESEIETYRLFPGAVIFNRTNSREWVGKTAYYDGSVPAAYAGYLIAFYPILLSGEYINYAMCTPYERDWCKRVKSDGINQSNINSQKLKSFLLPVPPLEEQSRIVSRINKVMPHIDQYGALEDARERLDTEFPDHLRKSILHLAVQGRLVEQDPSDEPASALLDRIRSERAKLVKSGKLKAPKGGESVIYRASDGGYYEKRGKGEPRPIKVPFDIPESWAWAHVKDFGYFTSGKTPSKHNQSLYGGDHLWVTSKDMKSFRIEKTGITLSDKGANELNTYQPGTMLFVVRSGILKRFLPIAILDKPATVNQDIKAFTLYSPSIAVGLAYFIKAFEPSILNELTKSVTTVDSLRFDEFQDMLIPVPPEAEWERIVEQLDSALGSVITNQ